MKVQSSRGMHLLVAAARQRCHQARKGPRRVQSSRGGCLGIPPSSPRGIGLGPTAPPAGAREALGAARTAAQRAGKSWHVLWHICVVGMTESKWHVVDWHCWGMGGNSGSA